MDDKLAVVDRAKTAVEIRAQVNLVQQVMSAVMKKGTHYGTIPGCGEKPTLFKPGAETILSTFRIAIDPVTTDLSTSDEARYRVEARATAADGTHLGSGIGEASSNEEKYKWRAAICKEEFDETPEDRKRMKWKRGYQGGANTQTAQVRTNPADVANTILKMAVKRAMIAVCLQVTACSDIFTQDIEDLADNGIIPEPEKTTPPAPQQKTDPPPDDTDRITEAQRKRLHAIASEKNMSGGLIKEYLKEKYGIGSSNEILRRDYDAVCNWIEKGGNP